jgi:hypothetical protein
MRAIVTGPFFSPMEAGRGIVRPSSDPDNPTAVDIPAWAFERQRALGNVTSAEAYEARRKAHAELSARKAELEREAEELEELAMVDVEVRALVEDLDALDGMDKPALIDLAVRRKLHAVNTRRGEDAVRKDVRAALEPLVAKAKGKPAS